MTDSLAEGIAAYDAGDYEKAYLLLYPLGAYKRNAEAQFYLGMIYFYGEGVEKNIEAAMGWWKKAMRNGHVDAAYRLSEIATSTKTTF
jgi:TPR repeat protein